ncbi:MAG: polysaccharide deacetylase family protein [Enhygromyxa sp.]
MPRRRFSLVFAILLALLRPTSEIALAQQPAAAARLGLEAITMPTLAELGLERAREPRVDPAVAEKSPCTGPEPRSRWAGRESDDEWIPGLYPARERYGDGLLALTFDDGPHKTRTPIVLDELARRGMTATFFLTGHAIRSSSYHLVQRMVREGHTLANHGWRHDVKMAKQVESLRELEAYVAAEFELTQIRVDLAMLASSAEDFTAIEREVFGRLSWVAHDREDQLRRMPRIRARHKALLESRGYAEDRRPLTLEWARPPGGNPYLGKRWTTAEREAFARAVNRQGLRMVMWNHGSGDSDTNLTPAQRRDPKRTAETARKAARRGGIYVAHDRIDPAALRAMLDAIGRPRLDVEVVSLERLWEIKLGCE